MTGPALLSAWRIHYGPQFIINWFADLVKEIVNLINLKNKNGFELDLDSVNIALTPLVLQITCLATIWDTAIRLMFAWDQTLLINLLYCKFQINYY